jgi:hypothetical protein
MQASQTRQLNTLGTDLAATRCRQMLNPWPLNPDPVDDG